MAQRVSAWWEEMHNRFWKMASEPAGRIVRPPGCTRYRAGVLRACGLRTREGRLCAEPVKLGGNTVLPSLCGDGSFFYSEVITWNNKA